MGSAEGNDWYTPRGLSSTFCRRLYWLRNVGGIRVPRGDCLVSEENLELLASLEKPVMLVKKDLKVSEGPKERSETLVDLEYLVRKDLMVCLVCQEKLVQKVPKEEWAIQERWEKQDPLESQGEIGVPGERGEAGPRGVASVNLTLGILMCVQLYWIREPNIPDAGGIGLPGNTGPQGVKGFQSDLTVHT
ncbi:unnamed protein product [Leuciscus chuanchicus]